jgi:excisionase family DNA binding protein
MGIPMATSTSPSKSATQKSDPFDSLAKAIGSSLANSAKQIKNAQIKTALNEALTQTSPAGRNARMLLIRHLVDIEAKAVGLEVGVETKASGDLISTAEAAEILGFSRPYVAMLIDQRKLKGATISDGGHRRVPRASVLEWAQRNQESEQLIGDLANMRVAGAKTGVYKSSEAEAVRRVKALSRA